MVGYAWLRLAIPPYGRQGFSVHRLHLETPMRAAAQHFASGRANLRENA
jgi:hypothetical protein